MMASDDMGHLFCMVAFFRPSCSKRSKPTGTMHIISPPGLVAVVQARGTHLFCMFMFRRSCCNKGGPSPQEHGKHLFAYGPCASATLCICSFVCMCLRAPASLRVHSHVHLQ